MSISSVYLQHLREPVKLCLQSLLKEWPSTFSPHQYSLASSHLVKSFHTSSFELNKEFDGNVRGKGKLFQQSFNKPEWSRYKNRRSDRKIIEKKVLSKPQVNESTHRITFSDEPDMYLSIEEWEKRYKNHPRFFIGVMGRLSQLGHLQKAKSLLPFMDKIGCPNEEAVFHNFLCLCVKHGHTEEMFDTYQIIKKMNDKIPLFTLRILIEGFSKTDSWKDGVTFLEQLKSYDAAKSKDYCKLLAGALNHGDVVFGEELFNEIIDKRLSIHDDAMKAVVRTFHCNTDDDMYRQTSEKIINKLLLYLREEGVYPTKQVADDLIHWFQRNQHQQWRAEYSKVSESGHCRRCGTQLERLTVTDTEFKQIHDEVMEKVIKSKDIFLNTSPEELNMYRRFIDESEPYDVVIDGLNVAHIDPYTNKSVQLRQIVVYFVEELRQRVLVIGRRHMLHGNKRDWNQQNMKWIRNIADCFYADNVSKDDPFLLYATLHSGVRAMYVSRDMMRDHRALLNPQTRYSFMKWQRSHQYVPFQIRRNRSPGIQRPQVYDTIIQNDGRSWHIPVDDGSLHEQWKLPHLWLCSTTVN
ncbi:mitochondrial ribonuclease P catalytic subunit-like [Glandiceps talaboti]